MTKPPDDNLTLDWRPALSQRQRTVLSLAKARKLAPTQALILSMSKLLDAYVREIKRLRALLAEHENE
jgi:hypothetical protein